MGRIKRAARTAWNKIKSWWVALLVALGLATGIVYAEPKDFSWTNATSRVDGSPFTAADLAETRIYCDGDLTPVIVVADGSTAATLDFGIGEHNCYATHVDTDGQESDPSNSVTFTVLPAKPNAPTLQVIP